MQLSRKALNARWAWTSAAAVAVLAVLISLDAVLRDKTGYGTADLQGVRGAWGVRVILDHWASPPDSALAGFALGLDYLFMPLYASALYFGAIASRERFAPKPSRTRRILEFLAVAPIAGALCDACENGLQLIMLTHGPNSALALLTVEATAVKYVGIFVGLALSLAAAVGFFFGRKEEEAEK